MTFEKDPETVTKAFLRGISKNHHESGFVFQDGEWIPLGDDTHEESINRLFQTIDMPDGTECGTYALADCFGVIHVTAAMGHLGIDANVDHVTTKQLETLATQILRSIRPNTTGKVMFDMHHHPKSRTYHKHLQKLVGEQYGVVCVS